MHKGIEAVRPRSRRPLSTLSRIFRSWKGAASSRHASEVILAWSSSTLDRFLSISRIICNWDKTSACLSWPTQTCTRRTAGPSCSVWLSRAGVFAFRVMQDIIQTLPSTPTSQHVCSMPKWPSSYSTVPSRLRAMSCAMSSRWGIASTMSASWTVRRSWTRLTRSPSPSVPSASASWATILTLRVRSCRGIRRCGRSWRLWIIRIQIRASSARCSFLITSLQLSRKLPDRRPFRCLARVRALHSQTRKAAPKKWWRGWTGRCFWCSRRTSTLSSSAMVFPRSSWLTSLWAPLAPVLAVSRSLPKSVYKNCRFIDTIIEFMASPSTATKTRRPLLSRKCASISVAASHASSVQMRQRTSINMSSSFKW